MASQVATVEREKIVACMTCFLCDKLLDEATTISVCLHSFCRKCIYDHLSDEEVDSCPVCNSDLGCSPVEKLRADHNLQDIREKIFPTEGRKINAPEATPSVPVPVRRKERSLSSLVVGTPKVPTQTGLTGKRTKAGSRKAGASVKKEESTEEQPLSSSSPESQNKVVRNKMQGALMGEPSVEAKDSAVTEGKADLWTPLTCLVEAANRTKSSKSNAQGQTISKSELRDAPEIPISEIKAEAGSTNALNKEWSMLSGSKRKMKEPEHMKAEHDSNGADLHPAPVKRRRFRAANRNRAATYAELCASAQLMLDASESSHVRRNNQIWFSLVASEDGKGDVTLPQISPPYLRVQNAQMSVSFLQKYLVKKLELPDLTDETEIEILCRGEPVLPTLEIQSLVDLWFRTASSTKRVPATVGSSAKDFVMVLNYSRKVQVKDP